mgnify:CR=1 FL=1
MYIYRVVIKSMKHITFILISICSTFFSYSQDSTKINAYSKIWEKDCQEGIFTRVPQLPKINKTINDSLRVILQQINLLNVDTTIIFKIDLSSNNQIMNIHPIGISGNDIEPLKKFIYENSILIDPVYFNGRYVCCRFLLNISIYNGKTTSKIYQ